MGSPPEPYYTNDIGSKNNILKQHVNGKSSSLPEFVDKMKELLIEQHSEREGSSLVWYRVLPQCRNLPCDRQKWFKMTEKQRDAKISHFMKVDVRCSDGDCEEGAHILPCLLLLMILTNYAPRRNARARDPR